MANSRYTRVYGCTRCETITDRDYLTVKRVNFLEMGSRATTIKSRVVDWLCPKCLVKDDVWTRKEYDAPGQKQVPDVLQKGEAPHTQSAGVQVAY